MRRTHPRERYSYSRPKRTRRIRRAKRTWERRQLLERRSRKAKRERLEVRRMHRRGTREVRRALARQKRRLRMENPPKKAPKSAPGARRSAAAAATARLAGTMVRAALQRVGVPEGRAEIAAKLMDAADVDPMAEDAAQRYAEAAQRLVAAVPEFVPAGGTGSSGEHPRRAANPNDDTASAFRRGMGR
ncbi:MAG: hypothetical protein ACLUI3_09410 [Christensenellales bacterium]